MVVQLLSMFSSPRIFPVSYEGSLSPCVCFNLYCSCQRLSMDVWNLSCLLTRKTGGPRSWLAWSLLMMGYMVDCGLFGTWFGWTVSSRNPHRQCLYIFSLHISFLWREETPIPHTLLLSSLEGNSLAPFWEWSGTGGLGSQSSSPRSLNHRVFSTVHLKKINLPCFPTLGMRSGLLALIWKEIWWSVSQEQLSSNLLSGPPHFTSTLRQPLPPIPEAFARAPGRLEACFFPHYQPIFSFLQSIRQAATWPSAFQPPYFTAALFSPSLPVLVHVCHKNLLSDIFLVSGMSEST